MRNILLFSAFLLVPCSNIVSGNRQVDDEVTWILNLQRSTGALLMNTRIQSDLNDILPYVTNLALTNVLRGNTSLPTLSKVKKYLNWYITHLNKDGTIWDYQLTPDDQEVSKNKADSTDSYAATFLSLVRAYLDTSGNRVWVRSNFASIRKIANAIWLTYDPELHLTYPLPSSRAAYLMDNVEVWKGLEDYGILLANLSHPDSEHYHYRAELIRNGIQNKLWNIARNEYQVAYNPVPESVNWTKFYSDTTANLWSMVMKLPEALLGERRSVIYKKFKQFQLQRWINLEADADHFPWVGLWEVILLNESPAKAQELLANFKANVAKQYYPGRPWGWHIGEAASFAVLLADTSV